MFCRLVIMVLSAVLYAACPAWAGKVSPDGYFKGIRLAGKVKVVENWPDIKVQVVDSFPDIDVQLVNAVL